MRLRVLNLALPLIGVVSCGGDNEKSVDAKQIDAKQIDAPIAPEFKNFKANEGGEVRFEYITFPSGLASLRATAFNYKTAGSKPFFPLPVIGGCIDADAAQGNWPTAQNPVAERVYLDPGLVVISGGPTAFTGRRNVAGGFDGLRRDHPANKYSFTFNGATANDAAIYAKEKAAYTVTYTGSADTPAEVFPDVMWMPANFQILTPPFAGSTISMNTDVTYTWTTPAQDAPAGTEILSLVGYTGPLGVSVICVEVNDGSMTVPAAMINKVVAKYPTGGTIARQTLTHVVKELVDKDGPTGNRIDFLAIWCYSAPFTVQ